MLQSIRTFRNLFIETALLASIAFGQSTTSFYSIPGAISEKSGHTLRYRIMPPEGWTQGNSSIRYPLILAMHGAERRLWQWWIP